MSGRNTGRVTIQDLAHELGLSKSAVSNALNDAPGVSDATRERVRALAQRRNWRAHALAKALSTGRTGTIGMCLTRAPEVFGTEMYYPALVAGIEAVLADHGCELLLRMGSVRPGGDLEVYRTWAAEHRVDGVVLVDLQRDDPRVPLVQQLGLPAVIQGSWAGDDLPVITGDPALEAGVILRHLAQAGRRRVTHVAGPAHYIHEADRMQALAEVGRGLGMELRTVHTDYTLAAGRGVVGDIARDGWASAVVCSSDLLALGVLRGAREAGLDIPRDVALVAWDDTLLLDLAAPAVTALDRRPHELGRATAGSLLAQLGIPGLTPLPTPAPRLVPRQSSAV